MAITVREARTDELEEVSRVMSAAYEEYMPGTVEPGSPWEEYRKEVADVWSRLGGAELIVAEDDGKILGAVTFYREGSGQGYDASFPPRWSGIRLLAVDPAARGRGLGKLLTEECIRRARELGAVAVGLHTTKWMAIAQGMYERMGFRRVPEHDFHPTDDIQVMAYRFDL